MANVRQKQQLKRNKNNRTVNEINSTILSSGEQSRNTPLRQNLPQSSSKKNVKKLGISLWMKYMMVHDDTEDLINEKLKLINFGTEGNIRKLWDLLLYRFKTNDIFKEFVDGSQLKTYFNEIWKKTNSKGYFNDNKAINLLTQQLKCQIVIYSTDKNLKELKYGKNRLSVHILHLGFNHFILLSTNKSYQKYDFTEEDQKIIAEAISIESNVKVDRSKLEDEKTALNSLTNLLRGKEKYDESIKEKRRGKKKYVYDIYSNEEISQMENIILCHLKLTNAHAGLAIPIESSHIEKFTKIRLNSRRCCGYNAFENDIVYVKPNAKKDGDFHTGKVVGVFQSNHKPVNNIYICKVSKDQGNLMRPLDKSFTKINVDNEAGRMHYVKLKEETENQETYKLSEEQMAVANRKRYSKKYLNNMFYSVFEISFQQSQDKPTFTFKEIQFFNPETCKLLFIVCYEYWVPSFIYPFGKIVGVLSTCESLNDNFHWISSMYDIEPLDINARYEKEIKKIITKSNSLVYVPDTYLPPGAMIFTIDNETTTDMDDAISYHKENTDIIIGIHISDVTKYISSTHEIYQQALKRFCTSYPPKFSNIPPVHLLSDELSTNILSLVPDKPRAVVSVFFRFEEEKLNFNFRLSHIIYPTFKEGVIVSKYKLNYEQVSFWLRQSENPEDVERVLYIALTETYKVAKFIRRARLSESYFVRQLNDYCKDFKIDSKFEAQILIEEFMILANEYVAKEIYKKYPNLTLLRVQDPVIGYENWLERLYQYTNMNFASQLKEYCNLLKVPNNSGQSRKNLIVSKSFYDEFCKYLNDDLEKAKCLLQNDFLISDFYMHITKWYELSNPSYYQCSENGANNKHFSLNKNLYTHFTSPIRRFTDIVVHRLLKSIINNYKIVDRKLDIDEICVIANAKAKKNKMFESLCSPFAILDETDNKYCFILDCVCMEINNDEIRVAHPLLKKDSSGIKFSNLSLDKAPVQLKRGETLEKCTLKWRKIIYSCSTSEENPINRNKFTINNQLYEYSLPDSCDKIFREVRRSYQSGEKLREKLNVIKSSFENNDNEIDITSNSNFVADPIIKIKLPLFLKNIMRIQFCKYNLDGLQKISPELLIATQTFQICLIHRKDPVKYFIPGGKLELKNNAIKKSFKDIKEYQEYFQFLVRIEALAETLSENVAFTLLNVPLTWIVSYSPITKRKERYGVIVLPLEFCMSRNIFPTDTIYEMTERYECIIEKGISSMDGDLLCLRYKKQNLNYFWVGHGQVVNIGCTKENNDTFKVIIFLLTHSDFDSFSNSPNDTYSVDVFLKSVVSKRQSDAIAKIDGHPFLRDVILGIHRLTKCIDDDLVEQIQFKIKSNKMFKFNSNQTKAMKNAMNQKLSLIWGPPGTGKTYIGCILSYAFILKNEIKKNNGVVVYCAPSNDAVNLVAFEMQKKFKGKCPKLLRIFGKQQERVDFPLPGDFKKNDEPLTVELQNISLHFLIRSEDNQYSKKLRRYDEIFKDRKNREENFSSDENVNVDINKYIDEYKMDLRQAKISYIENNNIKMVLCTTSVTATWIMDYFNVTQIIIDEAGMCKEPETLIPISRAEKTVENVVLIGDHKQLRPIIHSNVAEKYGLQISLFERYRELRPDSVTMLNYQYRMHPSICEFPSKQFYDSQLITKVSKLWSGLSQDEMKCINYNKWNGIDYSKVKKYYKKKLRETKYDAIPDTMWPGRRNKPYFCFKSRFNGYYPERLVFINVIGNEINQSVSSSTGNENSRGNLEEVNATGYIYEKLINRLDPPREAPKFITVLTQYRYQQSLLQTMCKNILMGKNIKTDPEVKTVIRGQGSENDYVIFSTVRSLKNIEDIYHTQTIGWERKYLGFITDENQINVALTRAKKGLIIIGNKHLLSINKVWKTLIADLERRGCVVESCLDFLN